MNVEIGIEAAQFPGKEYINGIFIAVQGVALWKSERHCLQQKSVHTTHIFGLSIFYYLDQGQQQPVLSYPAPQLTGTRYQDSDGRDYTPIDMPIPAPVRYQLEKIK
jgi:hypothetical protein